MKRPNFSMFELEAADKEQSLVEQLAEYVLATPGPKQFTP